MANKQISFISFDEAVAAAQSSHGTEFIGIKFGTPFTHLGVYTITVDADEPDDVRIMYEGGALFSSCGEDDFYDLTDAPAEARKLFYANLSELGDGSASIMGMNSEFVLQAVLPGLSQHAKYRDHDHFKQAAGAEFCSYWRQA